LCGNGNGDPSDDIRTPDGSTTDDPVKLGRSWKVATESGGCSDSCGDSCRRCPAEQEMKFKEETACGLLTGQAGPFQSCHSVIDPGIYLHNCVHDLCLSGGTRAALCQALEVYADYCQEEGVALSDWRTPAGCALSCPPNSIYTSCGTSCPSTCNDAAVASSCDPSHCVEGCECLEGFVWDHSGCMPRGSCGCLHDDLLHGPGEDFWADADCSQRCHCEAGGRGAVCRRSGCRRGEECRVEEGLRGCHPKSYGSCLATGATHYETFDGAHFVFQGTCFYQMVGLCEESPELSGFQVLVQNRRWDGHLLASIAAVTVKVYGKTVTISQEHPGRITVNEQLVHLPFHHREQKIFVYRGGRDAVLETDFGLTVTYDWQSQVTVLVPRTYSNALCGLCGNFNGDAADEMTTRDGQVTTDPDTFGHSWKVTDTPGCVELSTLDCPPASTTRRQQQIFKRRCGVLLQKNGPFGGCHGLVETGPYFQSCLHDACLFPREEGVVCPIIARYAAVCQAAGAAVGMWRTEHFCSLSCPPNSHYEICSQGCDRSCSSAFGPAKCSESCREGCVCDEGFVLSGDQCVDASQCGCDHQDFYYKVQEVFYPSKQEKCQCQGPGSVSCQKLSCPEGSEGKMIDGAFQCSAAGPGTCEATGDRSYRSFDGAAFNITGTCSYILAETCGGEGGGNVTPFVVKIKKEPRQKKKVSSIQEVTVEVYGLTLTLMQGKRGDILVDSISHHLPAILSEGQVQVHQHGLGVLLRTAFGLTLRYDFLHHVTIMVPQSHRHQLCGLCGNFNGQRDDDFLLPSGHQATSATELGSAWKTLDAPCEEECPEEECPVCREEKKEVLRKPNYCGVLTLPDGPFSSCHDVVDPSFYFQSCLLDLCLADGDTQVLCRSVESYSAACQGLGVVIEEWRRPSFCPPSCPANSSYSLCSNVCASSCPGLRDPSHCPQSCVEGCQCARGLAFDGDACVPEDQCGCFADGTYYKSDESVFRDNCQERCTCDPDLGLTCGSHGCTGDESCELREGVLGC
ncbi:FCGBP protein, partial [Rhinopomastus cyanomelas]|nr:FCGBP protein [Rhinopomastus cyanomelas]